MLKGLHLRLAQKLGLALVFSFALVVVALDILRTVEAIYLNQAIFTILETNFAVIICCLPSYRIMLNIKRMRLGSSRGRSGYGSAGSKSSRAKNLIGTGPYSPKIQDDHDPLKGGAGNGSTLSSDSIHYSKDPYPLEAQRHEVIELDSLGMPISTSGGQ